MNRQRDGYYHYSGVIHVHTTESDGTRTLEEVAAIGQEAGLDFIMFSDHMTLSNRGAGKEGFYGRTLVTVGYEHNDAEDNNHYLLYDSPDVYPADMAVSDYVAAGARDGAIGIIAHPDEIRSRDGKYPPYPWTDWTVRGFSGIELWNQMSEWMERLSPYNQLLMAFSPRKSMVGPTSRLLKQWDEINRVRRCVGVASVDAHAFPVRMWPLTVEIFPYKVHFRCLRTCILLPEPMSADFSVAKKQLYDALRECRVYIANIRWGAPDGFTFVAQGGSSTAASGGELKNADDVHLEVATPDVADICLVRNGNALERRRGRQMRFEVREPGVYRVEAWKKGRAWILSNHIRIGVQDFGERADGD
jgi:hypothetical protein